MLTVSRAKTDAASALQYFCRLRGTRSPGEAGLRGFYRKLVRGLEDGMGDDLAAAWDDPGGSWEAVRRELGLDPAAFYYRLDQRIEQAPNPQSRVLLAQET